MQDSNSGRRKFFFSVLIISLVIFVGGGMLGIFKEGGGFIALPLMIIFFPLVFISAILTLMGEVSKKTVIENQIKNPQIKSSPKFFSTFIIIFILAALVVFLLFFAV